MDPSSGMEPAPLGQPGFDLYADQGPKIMASMIALIVLSTSFVFLRLLSRKVAHAGYWWDDVLVVVALLLAIVGPILNMHAVKNSSYGKHVYRLGEEAEYDIGETFKTLWTFQIFFALATGTIKLCILTFYRRIFPVEYLRKILIIMAGIIGCFTITVVLITIFQCTPIHKFWDHDQAGQCLNHYNVLMISGSINTTLDFIVVLLPVPLLWQLRTSIQQKGVLTGVFISAGFVCIVSILRLIAFTRANPSDVTWNSVNVALWSAVEPCAGIISACMPSLRPLITLFLRSIHIKVPNFHRPYTRRRESGASSAIPWLKEAKEQSYNQDVERQWPRASNTLNCVPSAMTRVKEDNKGVVQVEEVEVPYGAINVKTEIRWSVTARYDYDYRVY